MPGHDFEVAVALTVEQAYQGTQVDLSLNMPEFDERGGLRHVPRAFTARIPPGATDGQRLRLPGKGGRGRNGGRDGDLYLDISLRPHALYRASGHDLFMDLPLAPWEAVLGGSIEVPTPGGPVRLKVPEATQAGRQLRLPRRGLPKPAGGQGDLYAIVQIAVPGVIGEPERELYRQLASASGFDPRVHYSGAGGDAQEAGHVH
jgi:curved DNA-binding protein